MPPQYQAAGAFCRLGILYTAAYEGGLNRLASTTDAVGTKVTYGYGTKNAQMMALATTITDAYGVKTTTQYDDSYRAAQTSVANYATLVYNYINGNLGSIERTDDAKVTQTYNFVYDAWGKILSSSGDFSELNPLRYRSYVYDQETGFYYLQSRYYDPAVGRFINADDVAYLGADKSMPSYNLFAYCHNNPVVGVDPTGYFLISTAVLIGVAVGGVIGGSLGGVFAYNIAKSKGAKGWKLAGKTALGVVGGGVAGAALGAAAGYGIGYLAGGIYANGLVAKSVDSGVKAFVSQANKVHHVLGKTGHNLAGYTTKSMGNLMRRTLINGSVEPYKSVFSAYWARKNSEVTFNIVNGALKISDMWIR